MRTATYLRNGNGKSRRALIAEEYGKYPLTIAVRIIYDKLKQYYKGITQKEIRFWLKSIGHCEYHHSGKYAKVIYYYDTNDIIDTMLYNDFCDYNEFLDNIEFHLDDYKKYIEDKKKRKLKIGTKVYNQKYGIGFLRDKFEHMDGLYMYQIIFNGICYNLSPLDFKVLKD